MNNKNKTCPTCQGNVHGRSDKIFCGIECKNEHHKEARKYNHGRLISHKRINRNYLVLLGIFGELYQQVQIHQDMLFKYGYDLNAFISRNFRLNEFSLFEFKIRKCDNGIIEITRKNDPRQLGQKFIDRWRCEFEDGFSISWRRNSKGYFEFLRRFTY